MNQASYEDMYRYVPLAVLQQRCGDQLARASVEPDAAGKHLAFAEDTVSGVVVADVTVKTSAGAAHVVLTVTRDEWDLLERLPDDMLGGEE